MQLVKIKDKEEIIEKESIELVEVRLKMLEAKIKFFEIERPKPIKATLKSNLA